MELVNGYWLSYKEKLFENKAAECVDKLFNFIVQDCFLLLRSLKIKVMLEILEIIVEIAS